jgi:hypothetical protein
LDRIIYDKNPNTFLVCIEQYLVKIKKKSSRGQIRIGYDNGNQNFGWVAWVKAKTLSGSDRVSQVRIAGLSGLARLSSDMAKTSPQAGFSLIPKLGPG